MKKDERICREVEQKLGRRIEEPQDFVWLSEQVANSGKGTLSVNTLKRLWGYLDSNAVTRRTTLDVLAQFLGFRDYIDFLNSLSPDPDSEGKENGLSPNPSPEGKEESLSPSPSPEGKEEGLTPSPSPKGKGNGLSPSPSPKGKGRKTVYGVIIVVVIALLGLFLYKPSSEEPAPVYVTELSQLSNTKQYIIHTRHDLRGALGVEFRHLTTTYDQAAQNRCDKTSPFAILFYKGSYYLFSVKDNRFIEVGTHETDAPLAKGDPGDASLDIHQEADSCFVIDFKICRTVCSLNVNSVYGPFVTNYGTINRMFDEGNLFMFEEVGDFDPTEAMRMLQDRDQEYKAALKTITAGRYTIIASPPTSISKGQGRSLRRFYLRADGCLTETLSDSCIFTIQLTDSTTQGDPKYRVPAWRIFSVSGEGADARQIGFECPHLENETYVPGHGRLCTVTISNRVVQDKVLFLGNNGCYAIRSTNVATEAWGCGLYWAVYDPDNNGQLKADYSPERTYVWKLEKIKEE